jgi:hypothetical protein
MFRIVVLEVVLSYTITLCGDLPMLHTWLGMASCNYSFWCLHDESDDKRVSCDGKPKRTYYRQCTSAHYDRAFTDDDDGTDIRPAVPFPYRCSHCGFEATDQDSVNKEAERCEKMKMEDPGAYEAHVREHTGVRPGDIPIKPFHVVVTDGLHRVRTPSFPYVQVVLVLCCSSCGCLSVQSLARREEAKCDCAFDQNLFKTRLCFVQMCFNE